MKTKKKYIEELNQLAAANGLKGVVVGQLIDILAYYLYEQQAVVSSAVLESNLNTCQLMSSFISHVTGYMYSTIRPRCQKMFLISSTSMVPKESELNVLYSGSRFSLIYDGNHAGPKSGKYCYECYISGNSIIEETITLDPNGGYVELSHDYISGDGFYQSGAYNINDYLTEDFNEYSLATRDLKPKVFAITTPNYGVRIYYNEYMYAECGSSIGIKYITYSNYKLSPSDITSIRITSPSGVGVLLNSGWSNNNSTINYYEGTSLGTPANPLDNSSTVSSVLSSHGGAASEYAPLLLASDYVMSKDEQMREFEYFLGNKFNLNGGINDVIRVFKDIMKDNDAPYGKYANLISTISVPIDSTATSSELASGMPIYAVVCSLETTDDIDETVFNRNVKEFTDKVNCYNGYNWSKFSLFGAGYDYTVPAGYKVLRCPSYNLIVRVNADLSGTSWNSSDLENRLSELLTSYYSDKLYTGGVPANGESYCPGYSIYDYDIMSLISQWTSNEELEHLGIITSVQIARLDIDEDPDDAIFRSSVAVVSAESSSYHYGANSSMRTNISDYYVRCQSYYAYINEVKVRVNR